MTSRHLHVDPTGAAAGDLRPAIDWLRSGRVVAFPTETFYGLAVDPRNRDAVAALFALKGRPGSAAIPLVADSLGSIENLCGPLNRAGARLATTFWPGPLTLVLAPLSGQTLAAGLDGGTGTVAVRISSHPIARALAAGVGGLVTSTSANLSGIPPAATPEDLGVLARDPRVFVVHAGRTAGGAASTIVDARGDLPVLIREGAIAWERVLGSLHE